jgi:hypothetical protein
MKNDREIAELRANIGRSSVGRIFETLVRDAADLSTGLSLRSIETETFIAGIELLVPRLRRFAPGGLAERVGQRHEMILTSVLSEGESPDETGYSQNGAPPLSLETYL